MLSSAIARYLQKHAYLYPGADQLPEPANCLKLCIVIPCLAERNLLGTVLDSLGHGSQRLAETEVIVLVNNPAEPETEILENNLGTLQDLNNRPHGVLRIMAVDYASPGCWLNPGQAGVGLARRLGMDLALRRLVQANISRRAAIACLDADSPVAPGYVDALLDTFDQENPPLAGICTYAHPTPEDARLQTAMIAYELWLRYYEAGLRMAGSLFAFPTIGSCTVVSAEGYALADGMPLRQAGEDFHFLRKLAKVSGYRPLARIANTMVFPAARVSNRVPFGTGRAMQRCMAEGLDGYLFVEPPGVFFELHRFFKVASHSRDLSVLQAAVGGPLAAFFKSEQAWPIIEKLIRNYPDQKLFVLAVHHWFDSLRIVRYANEQSLQLGRVWIFDAWQTILTGLGQSPVVQDLPSVRPGEADLSLYQQWLERLRTLELASGNE